MIENQIDCAPAIKAALLRIQVYSSSTDSMLTIVKRFVLSPYELICPCLFSFMYKGILTIFLFDWD